MLQAGRLPVRIPGEVDLILPVALWPYGPMSRMSENVGASTSSNPKGFRGLYRDVFTFYLYPENGHAYYYFVTFLTSLRFNLGKLLKAVHSCIIPHLLQLNIPNSSFKSIGHNRWVKGVE
jgi:hypothetical protein